MTTTIISRIARKLTVTKDGVGTTRSGSLTENEWVLDPATGHYNKFIPVLAIYTAVNTDNPGGVPEMPEDVSESEIIDFAVQVYNKHGGLATAKAFMNGLYLHCNGEEKALLRPDAKGKVDQGVRNALIARIALSPDVVAWSMSLANGTSKEFERMWAAKNPV